MWSFFGLLFFGGIFVIACIQDFIYDIIRSFELAERQRISNRVVPDYDSKSRLIKNAFCSKEAFVRELSEIDADMKFVFGDNWRNLYDRTLFASYSIMTNFSFNEGIIYNIYMASKGYITWEGELLGYHLGGSDDMAVKKIRALIVIEKYIKQYYPELNPEIVILPGHWLPPERMRTAKITSHEAFWSFFGGKKASDRKYRGVVKKLSDLKPEQWNDIDKSK